MLASAWKDALQRHGVVDVLKGTKLVKMAKDLGVWAYRLDDAFPADMQNKLVTLMNESSDQTKGGFRGYAKKHKYMGKGRLVYKALNM
ncbi:MAG: hypothetical protein ACKPKO_03420 [Candidatus Fonsibacter sp.]